MTSIDLVVTDLDGTLWDADERIHDRTLAALRALDARRVPLLVATGRRPRSAAAGLARAGLQPPAVLLDGALGRHLPDGRIFHTRALPPDRAAAVLEAFRSVGLEPCVYVERGDVDVVIGDAPSTSPAHLEMIAPWARRDDLDAVVASEPVFAMGVAGCDPEPLAAVAAAVGDAATAVPTRDVVLGGATLIVRPPGVSKWDGVLSFCADQGLDPDKVLAVGDGENDLELLRGARVACVVSDGCEPALALADHVIDPASDGGWSAILDLV
ncbi:MAG TPA: HAD family hydrolase [Egibacteraceae bacterium]